MVLLFASCTTTKSDKSIADDLNARIKASGLNNVDVKTTDRGVTVTAGALNFPADSGETTAETAKRPGGRRRPGPQGRGEGKGGTIPLAKNDAEEGRVRNRRVEITLLR